MNDNFRKVLFNLGEINRKDSTFGDLDTDTEGILKEREGMFHCWGDAIHCDSKTGQKLQKTVAIVEEVDTGRIYLVDPRTIIFVKS